MVNGEKRHEIRRHDNEIEEVGSRKSARSVQKNLIVIQYYPITNVCMLC